MQPLALLDGLEIKLRQLSAATDRQRADYARLVAENQQLKQALDRQTAIVHALKQKLERSQPATDQTAPAASSGEGLKPAQRETVEFCLREIDRCLEWLQHN